MNKETIEAYIKDFSSDPIELKEVNDTLYVKFDFLPYVLRDFIHHHPSYDHSLMINIERDCGCGKAYFLQAHNFYNIVKDFNPKK